MKYCYLFGPVTATFAAQNLHGLRAAGTCLTQGRLLFHTGQDDSP
jgi:hypothetical protein